MTIGERSGRNTVYGLKKTKKTKKKTLPYFLNLGGHLVIFERATLQGHPVLSPTLESEVIGCTEFPDFGDNQAIDVFTRISGTHPFIVGLHDIDGHPYLYILLWL